MQHLARFSVFIVVLLAASLACSLGPSTSSNNQPSLGQPTAFIPPVATNTPTVEPDESSSSSDQTTSSTSGSNSSSQSSNSSGSSGSNGSGFVACNPRTDWYVYRVVSGDTLAAIARRVNSSVSVLSAANCLANANTIRVGQALYVPQLPIPTSTPVPPIGRSGFVTFHPYLFADAGNYFLFANAIVTLGYTEAPSGTVRVDFLFTPHNSNQYVIGSDGNISDGVSVAWMVPSETTGTIEAIALRANGSIIQRSTPAGIGTSTSIPNDTCVVQSVTLSTVPIMDAPTSAVAKWSDLVPGDWMIVVGQTSDWWIAVLPTSVANPSIYDMKWIEQNESVHFVGPCSNLRTIPINLSSTGCFVSGTPDVAISIHDRPYENSVPIGSISADTSYEVLGQTSTGWYGINMSTPDVAPSGYGAYGLRWIKSPVNLPPGPQCGTLPTIY